MTENMETTAGVGNLIQLESSDPKIRKTASLAAIILICLLVLVIAIQAGFRLIEKDQPPAKAADLLSLRASEERQLTTYRYIDRTKGTVILPIERAMELLAKEAAEGRLPYSTAPAEIKAEAGAPAAGSSQ